MRSIAISTHTAFLAHSWAIELWQQHLPGPARALQMEALLRLLNERGLPAELAHHGCHAVNNHVIGYTLQEATMVFTGRNTTTNAKEFLAQISPKRDP